MQINRIKFASFCVSLLGQLKRAMFLLHSIEWQHISGFDSFVGSPEFTKFRESMLPYVAGPPDIQLYESPEDGLLRMTANPSYFHILKSQPNVDDTEIASEQRIAISNQWNTFIERSRLASGSNDSIGFSLNGFGLRKDNGAFLSVTEWKDHKVSGQPVVRSFSFDPYANYEPVGQLDSE